MSIIGVPLRHCKETSYHKGIDDELCVQTPPIMPRLSTPTQVHRLVVVNEQHHVVGVVSLSDILKYLVLTPHTG